LRYLKVGQVPAKADPEAQKIFLEDQLQKRIDEAEKGERNLLFCDASHFVMGAYLGNVWCRNRVFIKVPCGRQRFNVLGAYNPILNELTTVTNDSYINSLSVEELLEKIRADYNISAPTTPITIVLDNASYQRCDYVKVAAERLNIELLFLPTYSPNLNLIERLWRFVKKECLNSKYHATFKVFKAAISNCLDGLNSKYTKQMDSLMTLKFQVLQAL